MSAPFVHEATLSYDFSTEPTARTVERSVRRELGEIDGDRSRASLERSGATLSVTVEARDLTALRAGLNTWQTLVSVAERVAVGAEGNG